MGETIRPIVSGTIYLRMWLQVPPGSITEWVKLLALNGATLPGLDLIAHTGERVEITTLEDGQSASSEEGAFPFGEWFCLQVDTVVSSELGSVLVRVNGMPVVSLQSADTLLEEGLSRVVYGLGATGLQQTGGAVYVDDLVVSTAPVDCE